MKRWLFAAVGALLVASAVGRSVRRLLGRPSPSPSVLVSVVAEWVGAWCLWSLAGGLALRYGALTRYDSTLFLLLAVVVGAWHYRTRVRVGAPQGRVVFVGAQLAWLVIVLYQNGLLGY